MPPSFLGPCGHHCDNACGPDLCEFRPPASQESAPRPLRAPRAVKAQGATRQSRPNWRQMALELPSLPVRA